MDHIQYLAESCKQIGISLTDLQKKQFFRYYELLTEWNQKMNLTAITEYEEVVQKHFVDSLALVKGCDLKKINTLMDLGTGAGFPGIPLKIAFPWLNITLLDSLNKRIQFLNCIIDELGLEKIAAIHGRAEDYARQGKYREQFDLCVSRAVANLSPLSEYCLPFVKMGGKFISYKSGDIDEELIQAKKAIFLLGGKLKEVKKFKLPESDINRSFVIIEKIEMTAKKYPRKAGLPTKEPIV